MTDFVHLRRLVYGEPWAIQPGRLEAVAEVFHRRCVLGVRMTPEEIADIRGASFENGVLMRWADGGFLVGPAAKPPLVGSGETLDVSAGPARAASQGGAIAVINMMGIVAQHANQVNDVSGPGGISTERAGRALDQALADPAIGAIVLNFDSPGGSVYGVQELGAKILSGRTQKPIVAQVSGNAGSAAYWLASQASEIVVQPSGQVGSIGVYALHEDISKAADQKGVKFTFVSAGKYKIEGNPYQPLAEEAAAALQDVVNGYYRDFTNAVAKGRGVAVADVRGGFGEGRMVRAADAVKAGMADSVGTLDETLNRLSKQMKASGGARADEGGRGIESCRARFPVSFGEAALGPLLAAQDERAPEPAAEDPASPALAEPPAGLAPELHDLRRRRHAHRLRGA